MILQRAEAAASAASNAFRLRQQPSASPAARNRPPPPPMLPGLLARGLRPPGPAGASAGPVVVRPPFAGPAAAVSAVAVSAGHAPSSTDTDTDLSPTPTTKPAAKKSDIPLPAPLLAVLPKIKETATMAKMAKMPVLRALALRPEEKVED